MLKPKNTTNHGCVELTADSRSVQKVIRLFQIQFIALMISLGVIIFLKGFSWIMFICIGISFCCILASYFFTKKIARLAVKQDMLVFNYFDSKTYLTEIKSIHKIKSIRIFNLTFSKITFSLDGIKRNAHVVWEIDQNLSTRQIIENLQKAS